MNLFQTFHIQLKFLYFFSLKVLLFVEGRVRHVRKDGRRGHPLQNDQPRRPRHHRRTSSQQREKYINIQGNLIQ